MKILYSLVLCLGLCSGVFAQKASTGLKDAFQDNFLIGAAVNTRISSGNDAKATGVIRQHFNSLVAENCMKSGELQPEEGVFNWDEADKFVEYAEKNNQVLIGHCLVWHSQAPRWFFKDENGEDVSREVLIDRMRTHIYTVVGRYKGRIKGWDVVNEAVEDNGNIRKSKFYNIIGADFIKLAFQFAHEADPDAELYYNDYSMALPQKRATVCQLIRDLKAAGCRIDAVGMQSHCSLAHPDLAEYEKSIQAFIGEGVKVMITELDISVLPSAWGQSAEISRNFAYDEKLNPYVKGMPKDVAKQLDKRYEELFNMYLKYSDDIIRVTIWGVEDGTSWLNNFPVRGRTDYPLLFTREYTAKPVVSKLIKNAKQYNKNNK